MCPPTRAAMSTVPKYPHISWNFDIRAHMQVVLRSSIVISLAALSNALSNGVGVTPAMGWNPYNAFSCATTEAQYHTQAQALVNSGLAALGYKYVIFDCGWQGKNRTSAGVFTWDTTKLPSGVPALATFLHNLGLKFGVYSDAGTYACDDQGGNGHFLGSLGHETSDASTWAGWGADYLKYDNCFAVSATDFVDYNPPFATHYTAMRDALAATGRPILYSACEWGVQDPARWPGSSVANSWRMSNDIAAGWAHVFRIINQLVPITQFSGPGGFNDLDLLEVGSSGLTAAEQQTHFAFWAAAKSPLIISTDLTTASSTTMGILNNQRIIALNQDSLGKSIAFKRRYTNDQDVWSGPLADGSTVAVVINWQDASRSLTFSLADVGFTSATATNLVTGASLGTLTTAYTSTVAAHGVLVLKLSNAVKATAPTFTFYQASSGTLAGGANTRAVNSSVTVVGFVGQGGTLTITGVDGGSSGGTKLVSFDYINADFTYSNTACSNCRNTMVSVNGGTAVQVQMPISGQSWDILLQGYLVSLSGFKAGKTNTVTLSNPSAYAPDIWRMGIVV
ncbi:Alpha-galactosidase [Mycena indigotica]|uniref:Alpha-galactosidase n=1 Tax=Mycena indigotica TaxID=2126181 RepID=A0A8H6SH30_9AGAR|nr:Alpha-galactosidase [Mycena indigotica]KAF7298680.1 Alpha-galactosidase [Mycena indigotica]